MEKNSDPFIAVKKSDRRTRQNCAFQPLRYPRAASRILGDEHSIPARVCSKCERRLRRIKRAFCWGSGQKIQASECAQDFLGTATCLRRSERVEKFGFSRAKRRKENSNFSANGTAALFCNASDRRLRRMKGASVGAAVLNFLASGARRKFR